MPFVVDQNLLARAITVLGARKRLYWIVGGAGSGKSSVCRELSSIFDVQIYDMDDHIYGSYFTRYLPDRHPVNTVWAASNNGLAWLLSMSWEEYNAFNRAALPEYLDLLAEDLQKEDDNVPVVVDGGVWHPQLVSSVIPASKLVSLNVPGSSSEAVWEGSKERLEMKKMVRSLPTGEVAWETFLEFDRRINDTICLESTQCGVSVLDRSAGESTHGYAMRAAGAMGLGG